MSADTAAAVGAVLSGMGSVFAAAWFVKRSRKIAKEDCDQRMADMERAFQGGMEIGRREVPPDR